MRLTLVIKRAARLFATLLAPAILCTQLRRRGVPVAAAAALHEGGHLLWLRLCGGRIKKFAPSPFGLCITLDENSLSLSAEAGVYAAGSAANLSSALVVSLFCRPLCGVAAEFCAVSLFLACLNLLPLHPLDGGRLLEILIARRKDPLYAAAVLRVIGRVISYLLFLFSSYLLVIGRGGIYLLLLSLFFLAKNGDFERI